MPSFTMHIAVAKRYIQKHENEIKNEDEFIKGSIAPDMNEKLNGPALDKSKTHYGKWGYNKITTHIDEFLKDEMIDMKQDYWKGYFWHLLTDHYFYNIYFKKEYEEAVKNNDKFYYDFYCLNRILIEKYKIDIFDNVKEYMVINDNEPKYLNESKVIDFIEIMSNMDIQEKDEKIRQKGMDSL